MSKGSIGSHTNSYLLSENLFFLKNDNLESNYPIHYLKYDDNHYSDQLYSIFKIQEPKQFTAMVPKRKAQFLAGRIAANNALISVGHKFDLETCHVDVGQTREPIWPDGFIGSISHTEEASIAVAQYQDIAKVGIGIDVQTILNRKKIENTIHLVLTDKDKVILQKGIEGISEVQLYTLLFSVKESFFKAVFNNVKTYFDFDAVSISSVNFQTRQAILECNKSLNSEILAGDNYTLRFEFFLPYNDLSEKELVVTHCLI